MTSKEIWKDIEEFNGEYQISSFGNIKSFKRDKNGTLLAVNMNRGGYLTVHLSHRGYKKRCTVHRLVATHFIPIPQELLNQGYNKETLHINHKDENKTNNHVDNLEWCTAKYNSNYGTAIERRIKPVTQFDLEGNFIKNWPSAEEAISCCHLTNKVSIYSACLGYGIVAGGYLWRYTKSEYKEGYKLPDVKKYYHNTASCIPISQFDIDGNFIRKWGHSYEISRQLKICSTNITHACKGLCYSAGGFLWRYWKPEHIKGYNIFAIDYNLMLTQPVVKLHYFTQEILGSYPNALAAFKSLPRQTTTINGWQRIYLCCQGLTPAAFHCKWKFV